ncbi:MAG: SDR family NAD(P)-dependent oxidoreductase [Sphingomonadaceae bacterium]
MTHIFGASSSTDDVLGDVRLAGKRIFISGVSAGIGLETARALVSRGASIIGTARDIAKNQGALHDAARDGGGSIEVIKMDLADLASVRSVTDHLVSLGDPLDLIIENAGVMNTPFGRTKDGFELQFGTNFLGHFVLANRLAGLMREGARLVVLSSSGHRFADVDLDDPNFDRTPYDSSVAYGRSKTADALLAVAFDARHRDRGVRAAAVHPGVIWTELARYMDPAEFEPAFEAMKARHVALGHPPFELKTVSQGAATTIWAGITADADLIGGKYCEDCGISPILEDPDVSIFAPGVLPYAIDPLRAAALWDKANELVGEHF